jgi:hypothetical protein
VSRNALFGQKILRWLQPTLGGCVFIWSSLLGWAASTIAPGGSLPRARVVVVEDPRATDAFRPRADVVSSMVRKGITNITGTASVTAAWRSLVSTQDVVGIKVYSAPGANSGTRPAVVAAVVQELIEAGLPPKNIIVWDKESVDLRLANMYDLTDRYGIRVAGSAQEGYDARTFYESELLGNLVWGDFEFGARGNGLGRKSFVSKLVSQQMTKIINITPLLNHNLAGVSGNLYGLATGSVDNLIRFEANSARLARAVPEIYALEALSDHVVLSITDALICQYEGEEQALLHYSTPLNQIWFSKDPVALDRLALRELDKQRRASNAPAVSQNLELYDTAALLQLGVSDLRRIQVDKVP